MYFLQVHLQGLGLSSTEPTVSCAPSPGPPRPPISTARHGACAAAFGGYLYVCGGPLIRKRVKYETLKYLVPGSWYPRTPFACPLKKGAHLPWDSNIQSTVGVCLLRVEHRNCRLADLNQVAELVSLA